MKKIVIILVLFFLDRITKIYLINLQESGIDVDFYIFSFLNFFLVWNTGVGFGLMLRSVNSVFFMKQFDFLLLGIDHLVNTYNIIIVI